MEQTFRFLHAHVLSDNFKGMGCFLHPCKNPATLYVEIGGRSSCICTEHAAELEHAIAHVTMQLFDSQAGALTAHLP